MDLTKPVSLRQFAKMVGLSSDNSVRKAVERKSIDKGYNVTLKKIIPGIAAAEWGKEILPEFLDAASVASKPAAPKPKIKTTNKPDPVTAEDFVKEMMDEPVEEVSEEEIAAADEIPISGGMTKVEAERKIAVAKARMAELAFKEKNGEMIPRSKLTVLFEYGSNIRSALEALSDRILDDVLAHADDRQAAKRILDEEIYKTLNDLADPTRLTL